MGKEYFQFVTEAELAIFHLEALFAPERRRTRMVLRSLHESGRVGI
jgi:hypothetical protein